MRYQLVVALGFLIVSSSFGQDVDGGVEAYKRGDYGQAESTLRKAVEAQGDNARANLYLGLALLDQGKKGDAEPFLKKANEIESSGEAKGALARFYAEQKDYNRAGELLDGASGADASYARGLVAFNKKNHEEAARELESFIESHPKHAYAHYYAGLAYNGMKRPDKMLSHFEMFLRMKPDAPEARAVRSVMRTAQ